MEITLEPTKKAVSQFRDLWSSPSVINPPKQSRDSVTLETILTTANMFSVNLKNVEEIMAHGGISGYGPFLPPYASTSSVSQLKTEKKVQSTGSVLDWFKFWGDKVYDANNKSDN